MSQAQQTGTTLALARFVAASRVEDVPAAVMHEAKRALLNWAGCALGGCRDQSVDIALAALTEFAGPPQATIIGRGLRSDALSAAALNGLISNILDFDDTHLRTVIHPSVPVAAALCALAERTPVSGAQLLHAFILGVEVECRIGNAISPEHYDAGWHVTSTCGIFGAAAACAKLLGLNPQQIAWAFGLAANQAAGTTGAHGSMSKSWNMAGAARNGLLSALLASKGYTSTEQALEGERGFMRVLAQRRDLDEVTRGLGQSWELAQNTYKPYPCGIVGHPIIDGCLELRAEGMTADVIETIELRVHPLVRMLMGNPDPHSGLEAKLSVHHCAAAAIVRGLVGVREFTDASANDPELQALRTRVSLDIDPAMPKEAAAITVRLRDDRRIEKHIAHATGSLEKPMSDAALERKFRDLAKWGCPHCDAHVALETAWSLDQLADASAFMRGLGPAE
ncbi:MAG TPA: MmgE/PrpD family protein [Burkholderiales bacterium]|jgi:2-methylcitrate dehydratase PrpD|nr:MmgE/PrpD family protein [Burkholderiales bacterium]